MLNKTDIKNEEIIAVNSNDIAEECNGVAVILTNLTNAPLDQRPKLYELKNSEGKTIKKVYAKDVVDVLLSNE